MLDFASQPSQSPNPTGRPIPGRFYHIQFGAGGLLKTAARAYGVSDKSLRLHLAKRINNHPYNHRFRRPPRNAWERQHFPNGIIAFNPNFSKSFDRQRGATHRAPTGRGFAIIWVPPRAEPAYLMGAPGITLPPSMIGPAGAERGWASLVCRVATGTRNNCRGAPNPVEPVNVKAPPFRWICKIHSFRQIPGKGLIHASAGTGFLVGPRTVLTCAHNLLNYTKIPNPADGSCMDVEIVEPDYILVVPGKDGSAEPFGAFGVDLTTARDKKTRVPQKWRQGLSRNLRKVKNRCKSGRTINLDIAGPFDLGLISLKSATRFGGAKPGGHFGKVFLGTDGRPVKTTLSEPKGGLKLRQMLHIGGYPGDRPCTATRSDGRIDAIAPKMAGIRASIAEGNSGSPVWLRRVDAKGQETLHVVGVFTSHVEPGSAFCGRFVRLAGARKLLKSWLD